MDTLFSISFIAFPIIFLSIAVLYLLADSDVRLPVDIVIMVSVLVTCIAAVYFYKGEREEKQAVITQAVESCGLEVVENYKQHGDFIYVEATDGSSYYELYLRENEDGSYSVYQYKDGVYSLYGSESE